MIRRSRRYLTPAERATYETKNPFHVLAHSVKWQERKEGVVEVLECLVDKAWNLWGCDRGAACCPGGILIRTSDKEFVFLSGRVSSPSVYHFSFEPSDQFDGAAVLLERWPRTRGIYSARLDGDPVPYVHLSEADPLWAILTGPCEILAKKRLEELPEAWRQELLRE